MRSLLGFATALAVCLHYVSAFQTPLMLRPHDISPSLSRMQAELGSQLCKGSSVYLSNYLGSRDHTERWSTAAEGDVMLVVAPTCEKDVATVVWPLSHDA